jgi:predicted transcriptional regulator
MSSDNVELASQVVSAFVSRNALPRAELAALIEATHAAFVKLEMSVENPPPVETKAPAVPVRKSVTPDYLVCLEDGKKFKSLRRHLAIIGLTPEQYREKWNLPYDYPMVAPNYAAARSTLAKRIGLVQKRKKGVAAPPSSPPTIAAKPKRTRASKGAATAT